MNKTEELIGIFGTLCDYMVDNGRCDVFCPYAETKDEDDECEAWRVIQKIRQEERNEKPERIGKWWIERDKERCVKPYHCGNCAIYGSYIGYSGISNYCPRCGIKMDISKVYEYEEATKEARQNETQFYEED